MLIDMEQKDKKLLIKDLSGRIPYRHTFWLQVREFDEDAPSNRRMLTKYIDDIDNGWVVECKPYLRSMSSMTEEEYEQIYIDSREKKDGVDILDALANDMDAIDWLNAHHFDYRGLIDKGLAIEVTEDNNPYKD